MLIILNAIRICISLDIVLLARLKLKRSSASGCIQMVAISFQPFRYFRGRAECQAGQRSAQRRKFTRKTNDSSNSQILTQPCRTLLLRCKIGLCTSAQLRTVDHEWLPHLGLRSRSNSHLRRRYYWQWYRCCCCYFQIRQFVPFCSFFVFFVRLFSRLSEPPRSLSWPLRRLAVIRFRFQFAPLFRFRRAAKTNATFSESFRWKYFRMPDANCFFKLGKSTQTEMIVHTRKHQRRKRTR